MKVAQKPAPRRTVQEREQDHRDFIRRTDALKIHTEEIVLMPELWQHYGTEVAGLVWNSVPFDYASRGRVPKSKGIYAFVVHPAIRDLPINGWLFYIGEVGAGSSEARTFWKRYREYLNELKDTTRPTLSMLLERYRGFVTFYYCQLDPATVDIRALESRLITAAWPHANIKDFDVQFAQARNAFG